jgi:hypothetical protein
VTPRSEASAPPSEWPMTQTLALGYINVMLLNKFWIKEGSLVKRDYKDEESRREGETYDASGIK